MTSAGDLRPAPYNPRRTQSAKLNVLERTMRDLGDVGGVVYNERTGRLVGGHQRLKVIPEDAEIEIAHRFSPPTDVGTVAVGWISAYGERWGYRAVDWPEALEMAANVAANNSAGEWDKALLADLLQDLDTGAIDMELTGFTAQELERLLAPTDEYEDAEKEPPQNVRHVECPECGCEFAPGAR
jgi:hypothetical protein